MNDGKHSMFQGSVHDAPMRFGWDFNCNRIYFNFLIKIFLFVKMEKCHAATEKKSASCTPQIGHLDRTLLTRLSVAARFRLQFPSTFLKTPKQLHVPKYSWFMNVS